jgi:hypothetical protein
MEELIPIGSTFNTSGWRMSLALLLMDIPLVAVTTAGELS